jgi:NAD(P)-dependent dehydrogenase (short-subunit alcohol dehydrogenase family)
MEINFKDKVILVTGASRGIGAATAKLFAESGAKIIVHYHKNEAAANRICQELKGKDHTVVQANIANPNDIEKLVSKVIDTYGAIDILVNNAGVFQELDIENLSYPDWQQSWEETISTNLSGVANLSFLVAKSMIQSGGGKIINVSSRGAFRGEPNAPAYGASKAGLNALGQSMAKAFAPHHIYVYTIAPGYVETDMSMHAQDRTSIDNIKAQSPLNRIAQPEEIAKAICLLVADGTEYMTGCIVDMNGASYLRT